MSVQISTSADATATGWGNQRKLDHCSNGVLWAVIDNSGSNVWEFWYSTNDGTTWTLDSTVALGSGTNGYSSSFFIDQDDNAHFVYKSRLDGFIYYRRGTPNAGRTSWTWSSAVTYWSTDVNMNYPDIVAFRDPAGGGGWVVWVVASYLNASATSGQADVGYATITSGGTISAFTRNGSGLSSVYVGTGLQGQYPSIDFQHTGDGKTPVASNPALFAAWTAGKTGAGFGIRFKKATYSAGSWTWGTEREIDNTVYWNDLRIGSLVFDGTRAMMGGECTTGSSTIVRLWERDAADTTTTQQYNSGAITTATAAYTSGTTYHPTTGDVYITGSDSGATQHNRHKWTRASGTVTSTATTGQSGLPYISFARGAPGGKLRWVYVAGTSAPYSIRYDSLTLSVTTNIAVSATVTTSASIKRTVGKIAQASVATTTSLRRVVSKKVTATVTTQPQLRRVISKTLTATATTSATAGAVYRIARRAGFRVFTTAQKVLRSFTSQQQPLTTYTSSDSELGDS